MDRRLLPVRRVFLSGHVDGLRYINAPHCIRLYGIESVNEAPEVLERLQTKLAEGWRIGDSGLAPLLLVVRLQKRLREVRSSILRGLIDDPLDMNSYRRLRTHGDAIRHIGRDRSATKDLRVIAVKLGNRLKKVAKMMMSGKRPAAWFKRRGSIFIHTRQVLYEHYVRSCSE